MRSLVLALLLLAGPAAAQDWTVFPLGTSQDILDVENTSFSEKFVVGAGGFAAQSSGARTAWTQINVGTTADLLSVHQPSLGQVWTGAGAGVVRRQIAGSWENRNLPASGEDFFLFTRSSGASWAVGTSGSIYRTTNGGTSWGLSYSAGVALHSGSGFIGSTAYAVGDFGTILKTTNGGTAWTLLDTGTAAHLQDFLEGGQSTGLLAVGDAGTIINSFDGGVTWNVLPSGTTADLYAVSSSKQNSAWLLAVGADGTIIKSTDGGASWCHLQAGTTADLYGAEMVTNSEYIVGGAGGILLRSTNGGGSCMDPADVDGWGPAGLDTTPALELAGPFPNPAALRARFLASARQGQTVRLEVVDASGRRVAGFAPMWIGEGEPVRIDVDVSEWGLGVYFARLSGADGESTRAIRVVR